MKINLDSAVGKIRSARDFLVRRPFGYQTHDLVLALRQRRQTFLRDRTAPKVRPGQMRAAAISEI
jgi:hypothetical protein